MTRPITSLKAVGRMARMAWGRTILVERRHAGNAQGGCGLELALVHGEDAAADDLGGVGGLVQRQAEDRRGELADQGGGLRLEEAHVRERDA